jgi:isopentenyl phosphate kinase
MNSLHADKSSAANDVTGGMKAKIESSIEVAALGIDVFIAKAGTDDAIVACQGIKVSDLFLDLHL